MYASASRTGVDDYWIRIPLLHITMPLKNLNFDVWDKKGNPIKGREVSMYRDLFSQPVYKFSNSNTLFSVPVDTTKKSSWPGRAAIISGTMYVQRPCQMPVLRREKPGWSANPKDALLTLRQVSGGGGEPPGPVRALDYLIYFLLASCQGHNNDCDEDDNKEAMETLLLSKIKE